MSQSSCTGQASRSWFRLVGPWLLLMVSGTMAVVGESADRNTWITYYDHVGGLGPLHWPHLVLNPNSENTPKEDHKEKDDTSWWWWKENQCGGTQGWSGYGQSPISITPSECDTDMSSYDYELGTCHWNDLEFRVTNYGTFDRKQSNFCVEPSLTIRLSCLLAFSVGFRQSQTDLVRSLLFIL